MIAEPRLVEPTNASDTDTVARNLQLVPGAAALEGEELSELLGKLTTTVSQIADNSVVRGSTKRLAKPSVLTTSVSPYSAASAADSLLIPD